MDITERTRISQKTASSSGVHASAPEGSPVPAIRSESIIVIPSGVEELCASTLEAVYAAATAIG